MTLRRTLSAACLALTAAAVAVVPAQAAPGDAVAEGVAGAVTVVQAGTPVTVDPIAPCTTTAQGPAQGSAGEVSAPGVATFTDTRTTCAVDGAGEVASATVSGGAFRLDALREHGGPRIRLSGYTAKCGTTAGGSNSSIEFAGLSGVEVPDELPANHVVTVPGQGDAPMATVTFNEVVVPSPPDGSMTVHLMHIRLFPKGGPARGDVVVGTVRCSPAR
jgi:hypothetical protein